MDSKLKSKANGAGGGGGGGGWGWIWGFANGKTDTLGFIITNARVSYTNW